MDKSPLVTDAPLSARELARYRLQLADGIDEGYAAVYREGTPPELSTVYALRVGDNEPLDAIGNRRISPNYMNARFVSGRIVAVVSGRGACFEAVADYLKSLTQ